jgi:hypothetical protein
MSRLRGCARCGGEHEIAERLEVAAGEVTPDGVTEPYNLNVIVWRKLERPIDDATIVWTHWAPCPTNGDPILMRITERTP